MNTIYIYDSFGDLLAVLGYTFKDKSPLGILYECEIDARDEGSNNDLGVTEREQYMITLACQRGFTDLTPMDGPNECYQISEEI